MKVNETAARDLAMMKQAREALIGYGQLDILEDSKYVLKFGKYNKRARDQAQTKHLIKSLRANYNQYDPTTFLDILVNVEDVETTLENNDGLGVRLPVLRFKQTVKTPVEVTALGGQHRQAAARSLWEADHKPVLALEKKKNTAKKEAQVKEAEAAARRWRMWGCRVYDQSKWHARGRLCAAWTQWSECRVEATASR